MFLIVAAAEANPALDALGRVSAGTWVTAGGAAMVAFLAGLAFSKGVVRQLMTMASLALSVMVAWFVFTHRAEVFGSMGANMGTDRLLLFSAGAGLLTFFVSKGLTALLAAAGLLKLFGGMTGWKGMMISTIPSAFMLWVGAMVLRLVGNLYGLETASVVAREGSRISDQATSLWQEVSQSLDRSTLGSIAAQVDPFDMRATANLARLLILWPDGTVWAGLAKDAKTRAVLNHAEIQKLGHDPEVRRCIDRKDFAGLIQLKQVSKAAANEELRPVLSGLALEQAMDTIIYKKGKK
jgi:hypothetical protein